MKKVPIKIILQCNHEQYYSNHIPVHGERITCFKCHDSKFVVTVVAWKAVCNQCNYVRLEGDRMTAFDSGWNHAEKKGHLVEIRDPLSTGIATVMPSTAPLISYAEYETIIQNAKNR